MPVILAPEGYDRWLDPDLAGEPVAELLKPYPAEEMTATAVGTRVNSPRFDDPACVDPVG
jgi:putative SOS response-associated peptidase YedK